MKIIATILGLVVFIISCSKKEVIYKDPDSYNRQIQQSEKAFKELDTQ